MDRWHLKDGRWANSSAAEDSRTRDGASRVGRNKMSLKQVLGVLTLLLVLSTVGMAAGPQLTNINASAQGNATVITLHASGAFTHTEYRPTDTLLLVDLSGVAAANWKEQTRQLDLPGVTSYKVIGYTGANGADVARLEVTVAQGAVVNVQQTATGLTVKVGKDAESAKLPAIAAVPQPKPAASTQMPVAKPAVMKTEAPVRNGGA